MISEKNKGKILVTGARGFIGSVVFRYLQSRGYEVEALAGDIRASLPSADIIIHCAGRKNDEPDSYSVNVEGAHNILTSGAKIINISTAAARLPKRGVYGDTKAQADEVLKDHVTLRFSLVYGNGGILKTLVKWTNLPIVPFYGNAIFKPLYVEDAAKVIEDAIGWQPGVYDIGGPDGMTLRDLVHVVARIFHHKDVLTIPIPRFVASLQLTQSNLLGAEQTLTFTNSYGRPLMEGLNDICNQMSQ
jgi:nucleoside-diphosphate-sugar epimerase